MHLQIAIDARLVLPQMTGAGRYLLNLIPALGRLPGDDLYEVWLQAGLPPEHAAWQMGSARVRLRQLPIPHMDPRQSWVVPAELARSRPNLFHYPHFDLPVTVTGRVVATIYDLKYIVQPEFFPRVAGPKRLVMLALMAFTVRRADRVITISESTRQDMIARLGAKPEKVVAIPLGVDEVYFRPVDPDLIQAVLQKYHLERPFVLFVSERRPHKNLPGVLRAFAAFQAQMNQPYHLVIAGKRYADYDEPEQWAQRVNLGKNVHFLDYVPDADLPALYHAAEAHIQLSYYEGFGLSVLEAMAAGTPVVAANATSLPEVAGQAGLLVPPDDERQVAQALRQVVAGGSLRQECITRGLERARAFTWEACARKTLNLYHQVAGS